MSTTDAERIVIEIKRVDGTRFEVVVRRPRPDEESPECRLA